MLKKLIIVTFLTLFHFIVSAQVVINEASGDSGNNDSENDGIVELKGAPGTSIGCYVISNSEWVVVLPSTAVIPASGIYLIACKQAQSNNPSPGSGLACPSCDFMPTLPVSFDICDPANAPYVDFSATGFTIDNATATDGDQIVLWDNNGAVLDAIQWGGGSTSINDNNTVASGSAYTLTATGAPNTIAGVLPLMLKNGGSCYSATKNYIMPAMGTAYTNLTNLPAAHSIDGSILQGCNSSFARNATTGAWEKTEHPTPGLPNNFSADTFYYSGNLSQCQSSTSPITITYQINNWQQVEPNILSTVYGKVGTFLTNDNGTTQIAYSSIVANNITGKTTLTYTFTPSFTGTKTYKFNWKDKTESNIASSDCGSNSYNAVANYSTPSDCYSQRILNVNVIPPMIATKTSITCPTDFKSGIVNIGSLISGGGNKSYQLQNNGTTVSTNITGVFSLPTTLTPGPITVLVTDSSGCTSPIIITINNNCLAAPVCPLLTAYGTCTTAAGTNCAGDILSFSLTGTNLPNGGKIEWVNDSNNDGNVYDENASQVLATQNITTGTTIPSGAPVINEVIFNATNESGTTYGEGWEIAGTPGTNIGCMYFTDGDFVLQLPSTATIPADGFYVIGTSSSSANWNSNIDLLVTSTTVVPNLTNGGEYLAMFSPSNSFLNGVMWGSPSTTNTPATTSAPTIQVAGAGCSVLPTNATVQSAVVSAAGTATNFPNASTATTTDEQSISRTVDVSGSWTLTPSATLNTMGSSNQGATTTFSPTCATYTISASSCGTTLNVKPRVTPIDASCANQTPTLTTKSYTVVCPSVVMSGGGTICSPSTVPITIDFQNYSGTPSFTINYSINGIAQTPIVTSTDPYILNANTNGDYAITSVTASVGNCFFTTSGLATVFINPSPSISLNANPLNKCPGVTTTASVSTTGNLPFYVNYTIDGIAQPTIQVSSNTINIPTSTLTAGTHTIALTSVIDDAGCSGTIGGTSKTFSVLTPPTPVLTTNAPICKNSTLNLFSSAVGSSYTWNNYVSGFTSTIQNPTITSAILVDSGIYFISVVDANSCVGTSSINIIINDIPTITTVTKKDLTCIPNSGTCTVVASAYKNPTIIYSISPSATQSSVGIFTGLTNTTYTITASSNGCSTSTTVVLNLPNPIVLNLSKTDALCNNGNGNLNFSATGGLATYSFSVNGTSATSPFTASSSATAYTVNVTDANSCVSTSSIIISSPNAVAVTATPTNALCNGTNGSLSFSAIGGNNIYTFTVNGVPQTSPYSTTANTYTIIATDGNNCANTSIVTISQPNAVVVNATPTNALCNGTNGSLSFSATGGNNIYTFTVNGVQQTSPYSTTANTYTIIATDGNNCANASTATISQPNAVVVNATPTNALCNGTNGSLSFSATGGNNIYTFTINGVPQTSPYSTTANTYTIIATDGNNCVNASTATISQPNAVVVTATPTNALCNGTNGSLSFSATGGNNIYTFTVNGVPQTSPYTTSANTYTIIATDGNNCANTSIITISQPDAVVVTATPTNALCNGTNGSLSFSSTGGNNIYTFTVNGVPQTSPYSTSANTYTIIATDGNNCANTSIITISQPDAVVVTATPTNALCNGTNGSLSFSSTGGNNIYTFTVNGVPQTSPYSTSANTYTIIATDGNNCANANIATISQPNAVVVTSTPTNALCNGTNGSLSFSAIGGNNIYTFTVNGVPQTSPYSASANTYTIIATDGNNCANASIATISQPNAVVVNAGTNSIVCSNAGVISLNGTPIGGVFSGIGVTLNTFDPTVGTQDLIYTYTDANGCIAKDTTTITVNSCVVNIFGNIFNDVDALEGSNANRVDGNLIDGTNPTSIIYVNLIDSITGLVIASTQLSSLGTYSFTNVSMNSTYSLILSTSPVSIGTPLTTASLPTNYVSTGENIGSGIGSDGNVNSIIKVNVVTSDILNINFGIEIPPTATSNSEASQLNPSGTNTVAVSPSLFAGVDPTSVDSITIYFPNSNNVTTFIVNGISYTSATYPIGGITFASNNLGEPLVSIAFDPIDGALNIVIPYQLIDAANKKSNLATVTLPFTTVPLAINGLDFTGTILQDCNQLNWTIDNINNIKYFEILRSNSNNNFNVIAKINNDSNIQYVFKDCLFDGINCFYQLKLYNINSTISTSNIVLLNRTNNNKIDYKIYPNPIQNELNVLITDIKNKHLQIQCFNNIGSLIYQKAITENTTNITTEQWPQGVYLIKVLDSNQIYFNAKVIK